MSNQNYHGGATQGGPQYPQLPQQSYSPPQQPPLMQYPPQQQYQQAPPQHSSGGGAGKGCVAGLFAALCCCCCTEVSWGYENDWGECGVEIRSNENPRVGILPEERWLMNEDKL
ncbi:hypothetical protein V500_00880 [Pseudogymnoascus sp. VKM F-4518 (FW-2643)]|nr:hypothetical protein V500_00880 [Pseudogymnoascus sp. VKM F-4518 (FW-2643)]